MYDICGVGHITLDKIITTHSEKFMPGGTSYYFSNAVQHLPLDYLLVTSLGKNEMTTVTELRALGIQVNAFESHHSVYFENRYGADLNQRTQRVLSKADPFTVEQLSGIEARIFHLGPLLADDMSADFIMALHTRGLISLDVQGFLRRVEHERVVLNEWTDKKEIISAVEIIKADHAEMTALTGCHDPREGCRVLNDWGVKEVVVTFGNKGSLIYADRRFHEIRAFVPRQELDATGCGDTYMAGYLSQRIRGKKPQQAGEFASAMAGLKIETYGPFTGTEKDVLAFMLQQTGSTIPAV